MTSTTTAQFRRLLYNLPTDVRAQAKRSYEHFREDPFQVSPKFKKVNDKKNVWSVRIGLAYRALGVREGEQINWFWIGSHAEYDQLI